MAYPDDESFDSDHPNSDDFEDERPTTNERRRRTDKFIKENPDYVLGRVMAESVKQRREIERLNRKVFGRQSIRPQVQTAGLAAGIAGLITLILQLLRQAGILK